MRVSEILSEIKSVAGSNAKKAILESHSDNETLKRALRCGLDQFTPFNVVKIPKTSNRIVDLTLTDAQIWQQFFNFELVKKMFGQPTESHDVHITVTVQHDPLEPLAKFVHFP